MPLYFLHDLYAPVTKTLLPDWTASTMAFDDQDSLLLFYFRKCGNPGRTLNITGNDTYAYTLPDWRKLPDGSMIAVPRTELATRRFLVTDGDGRHIDIREWGDPKPAKHMPRRYARPGKKQHRHRACGPSFRHRTVQGSVRELHKLDDGTFMQVPAVRNKTVIDPGDVWDAYERRYFRRPGRCWKDQCKATKQYARHVPKHKKSASEVRKRTSNQRKDDSVMSMNTYPINDVGLDIAPDGLLPYVMLAFDVKSGAVPADVQTILDENRFDEAVRGHSEILETNGYFDISCANDALDGLGIESAFCSNFDGSATPINPDSLEPVEDNAIDHYDDTIVYIPAKRSATLFKPAYASFDELLAEMKEAIAPVDLPDGFDIAGHIVSISGTYYC